MRRRTVTSDYPTIREAAVRAHIGERALRGAVHRREIPLYQPPGTWPRVFWPEVEAWIRGSRVGDGEGAHGHAA